VLNRFIPSGRCGISLIIYNGQRVKFRFLGKLRFNYATFLELPIAKRFSSKAESTILIYFFDRYSSAEKCVDKICAVFPQSTRKLPDLLKKISLRVLMRAIKRAETLSW